MFSIGTKRIATLNPNSHEVTNQVRSVACPPSCPLYYLSLSVLQCQWPYNEFVAIQASPKASNEFVITVKKGVVANLLLQRTSL